jgi:hypothetical protein
MMDAFWAIPEWAPPDESHLLGSLSAVTKIAYGAGRVTYSTFDTDSTDVLRLNFVPDSINVGGRSIPRRNDLQREGFTFDEKARTLSIRHTTSRDVDIQGKSDQVPPSFVTFDDPHLPAGTPLLGQYPSGVIEWSRGEWQIGTPFGKFGTFTLVPSDPNAKHAEFHFYAPRIFEGVDVYNDADSDATLTIRSSETHEVSYTIKPKELLRLRTGWRDPSSKVILDFTNGRELRFDNLAYSRP